MSKRVIPPTSVWLELETLETGEFGLGSGSVILPDEIDVEYWITKEHWLLKMKMFP
ncbi:MAG: hypothetical protein WBL67_18350 [Nitrososphaeraceae archaeon]